MSVGGPIPKRSSQRRRRNKVDIDHAAMAEAVEVPMLGIDDPHPLVWDFYEALQRSGQARWYEPSDWARARVFLHLLSRVLHSGKPSSMMYGNLQRDMDALLVSEGERRRVRMEIDRMPPDTTKEDAKVSQMARYRQAAGDPS